MRLSALVLASLVAFVSAAAALAANGGPLKRVTRADQARARATVLRRTDFQTPVIPMKPNGASDTTCAALDQSDLVLTGEAASQFASTQGARYRITGSAARVYATGSQSVKAWRRTTSAAALACYRADPALQTLPGAKLVSVKRIAFPQVAPSTYALRAVVDVQGLRSSSDVVGLRNGRAQVALVFLGLPDPYPRAEEVRLARLTATRMAAALRRARTS